MIKSNNWKIPFFTIWAGQAISLLTSAIIQYAIIWYLTDITKSAMVLSAATLIGFLPQGLLGPFIGAFIDRHNRKHIMIISDSCIAIASLAIVVMGRFGEIPLWLVMSVLFIRSVGSAFHSPSLSAVTPLIVPADQLTRCAGYSQTLQSVSLLLSPPIAAVLYAAWDISNIIFLDVFGAIAGVATLALVYIPTLTVNTDTEAKPNVWRDTKEGLAVLRSHKGLLPLTLVTALYLFGFMPINALFPLVSMDYFNGDAVSASVVEVAFSAGMLIGSIVLGIWGGFKNKITTIILSILLMGASLVATGLLPVSGFILFVILSGIMGLAAPFYSGVAMALIQERVEPEYLGRVMSISMSIMVLATPIGLAFAGVFSEKLGVMSCFFVCGIIILISGALCWLVPSIRDCDK
ncbi:MFS transporter [Hydrogenoanaerobacterium sp.]|uniref:MFS transporter n=1 Tax=Hydrogenoanaerobacterium sp. TaxID=2953763 RepID=UPI0037BFE32C